MSFVIEQDDGAGSVFYSAKEGRNFGSPGGGWTGEQNNALQFARERDAREFLEVFIPQQAPFCTVRPVHVNGSAQ